MGARRSFGRTLAAALLALSGQAAAAGTAIDLDGSIAVDPARGVDGAVDYAALVFLGPWDDRNYSLTAEDLSLLAANEADLREPLPAFFRVALRRARPALARDSGVRYPMYALNVFRQQFGGYLVDGDHYLATTRRHGRYYVDLGPAAEPATDGSTTGHAIGEFRMTEPERASEVAMAIDPMNPSRLVAGTMGPGQGQRMHYSTDGGQTWTLTDVPFGGTCCDPSVAWSSTGQFAYATTLGNCGVNACELYFYRSADGGATWTDLDTIPPAPGNPRRTVALDADREFLHVDGHAGSPHLDTVYITYHVDGVMHLARSTDFGGEWSAFRFSNAADDLGAAGDVATDRNGHVHFAWPAYNSRTIRVRKSIDGGVSFGATTVVASTEAAFSFPIPAQESRDARVYLSAAADLSDGPNADNVYLAWTDSTAPTVFDAQMNHARIRVATSTDGGASWTVTTPHETADALTVDRFHPALAVGPDGTVHLVFYDTRNLADRTAVDLYYVYSGDGGQAWSVPQRITTVTSPNITDGFEYGDYNALDMVLDDLIAAFGDNRNESGLPEDSTDVYVAAIAPGGGAGRVPGGRGVSGPPLRLAKNVNGTDLDLTWSGVCGAGDDYAVYEGLLADPDSAQPKQCSTAGATSATIAPATGDRFYVVVATAPGVEGSYGLKSDDTERTPAASACFPQIVSACP